MAESSLSLLLWALGGCRDQVSEVLWAVGLGHPCVKLQGSFSAASRAELQDLRPGSEEIGGILDLGHSSTFSCRWLQEQITGPAEIPGSLITLEHRSYSHRL